MSRFRRMAHNVASSYAALIAASFFSLATFPLALHYLGAKSGHFALWLLMSTITGYMSLIDFGMSGSVARLLIDYKDQKDSDEYGGLIKTGWLVLLVQAVIILGAGIGLAPWLASILNIEPGLRGEFERLLGWQSGSLALAFGLRIFSHILNAHQRNDVQNYSQITGFILNFSSMWLFFRAGCGVFSLAWATLLTNFYSGAFCGIAGWRMKFFPRPGAWGKISSVRFQELFSYGQAMFLVALGTQMINASQILIVQRELGAAAATLWGAGIRVFTLVSQLIYRVFQSAAPAYSEMVARGEMVRLRHRYREMVILTASLSAFFAVSFAMCNSAFVTVWTGGEIAWPAANDLALAVWMVVLALLHCYNALILLTKQVGFMRYVYFIEGVAFITTASFTVQSGGLLALIAASVLCSCVLSGAYGLWRVHLFLELPAAEIGFRWLQRMFRFLGFFLPAALLTWWLCSGIQQPILRLAGHATVCVFWGGYGFLRFGLPPSFQSELMSRAPRSASAVLTRIFGPGLARSWGPP